MKQLLNVKIKILPALILGISLIGVITYAGITQKSILVSPRNQITAMGWNDLVKDITALNLALDGKLDINGDGSQLSGIGGSDAKIGTLTNTKWCVSDGSKINCASDAPSGGVSAWGDLTGIPAGFSDGTDNVLDETTVDSYANNNGYLKLDANSRLGIGVANPTQKLEVDGNMAVSGFITSSAPTEDNQVAVKGYVDLMLEAFTKFVYGDDSNDAVFTGGKVGIGLTNPTESLTVTGNIKNNGFVQIGQMLTADLPVCNSSKLGAMVYNITEDDLFVCTARSGGTWKPLGEDDVPSAFTFTDQTEVNLNSVIESNIVQITGFSVDTKVNIAGVSTPQFRICADATCASVLQTWGNTEKTMSNNQYLQLRQTSSSEVLASVSASVSVGGINEVWQVETKDQVALYVDDVFSTYLYTGNGATQTINNGVDLAGSGGMVWVKSRSNAYDGYLFDTIRGAGNALYSAQGASQNTGNTTDFQAFNSDGFRIGPLSGLHGINESNMTHVSWTFRKAPKFFDIVTYTGDGTSNRQIAHSLGIEPGMINTKSTSTTGDWNTYHRSATGDLKLNTTAAQTGSKTIVPTASTTTFTVSGVANSNGVTYVAYLYAHDPSVNGVIQCGSYVGNGVTGNQINLGWEPQHILFKSASGIGDWKIYDTMRGISISSDAKRLQVNDNGSEYSVYSMIPNSTGFVSTTNTQEVNTTGSTYIYCAIRRPNKAPVSSAGVYKAYGYNGTDTDGRDLANAGFPPDLAMFTSRTQQNTWWTPAIVDRLRGNGTHIATNRTDAEGGAGNGVQGYFTQTGITVGRYGTWGYGNYSGGNPWLTYYFRRAPGFFDIVAYTGTGVARTVPHNLGVVPEMMIVKRRDVSDNWEVYSSFLGNTSYLTLNNNGSQGGPNELTRWNSTTPSNIFFTLGTNTAVNGLNSTYISYLFATLPGISKVGSYTGTGAQLDIDAGFATGPAFLLIKRTDATGDWYLWDSTRGIVSAGNDPYLLLNSTAAEVTNTNYIDPINTGFRLTSTAPAALNASGGTYIYYSVAKP